MKNKNIFKVEALDLEKFAASLGLPVTPKVRFLKGKITESCGEMKHHELDRLSKIAITESSDSTSECESELEPPKPIDRSDDEDGFLRVKRRDHDVSGEELPEEETRSERKKKKVLTKAAIAKKMMKKKIVANKKTVFDEEGDIVINKGREKVSKEAQEYEMENSGGIDIEKARTVLKAEDKFDKKLFRERIKEKRKERKRKLKEREEEQEREEAAQVHLASDDEASAPDISWLPDPDKIYGKQDVESAQSDRQEFLERKPKRKRADGFRTGLSLAEDEELALRLLQGSR